MKRRQQLSFIGIGVLLHELFFHLWVIFDHSLLPLRSSLLRITLDEQGNSIALLIDLLLLVILLLIAFPIKIPKRHLRQWYE